MIVSEITLYNILKTKFGEQEAQTVVEGIKQEVKNEFEYRKEVLATKEDIVATQKDILNLSIDMEKGFRENLKWTVATTIACSGIILAVIKLL